MNGGNPTAGPDDEETVSPNSPYSDMLWVLSPDPNYSFVYDFGRNSSLNGVIEYR